MEAVDGLGVERSSRGNGGLNNTLGSVGKSLKLVSNGREERQSVVLSKDVKEVGDGLLGLGGGGKSADDSLLVFVGKSRVAQDFTKLLVLRQNGLEGSKRSLSSGEGGRLDRGGVLKSFKLVIE